MKNNNVTEIMTKKSFYIYNTPGEHIFTPRRDGIYKITVVGGGSGGYGGGGFLEDSYPYQSAGGGGGGTSVGRLELTASSQYKLTVGNGGSGGNRSYVPGTMNRGKNGGKSIFDKFITAYGGHGGHHHTQDDEISGRGGKASDGDNKTDGGDGKFGYYLTSEKKYSCVCESGGSSTHGTGGMGHTYRQIRQGTTALRHIGNGSGIDGLDGRGYGAGGGGAGFYSFNKSGYAGGNGSCGLIIIEEV